MNESRESQMLTLKTKANKSPINTIIIIISFIYFLSACMIAEIFSRTSIMHLGNSLRRPLWADGVSPQMNSVTSCDQFQTNNIGECGEL